jgi:hypothetical protein
MKETLKTILNYVLIGVIGFLPVALVFQIIVYVERVLKDFLITHNEQPTLQAVYIGNTGTSMRVTS